MKYTWVLIGERLHITNLNTGQCFTVSLNDAAMYALERLIGVGNWKVEKG